MMDWHSIYIVDKKIFLFENVAFSQFLTLEIADLEKLRLIRHDWTWLYTWIVFKLSI